jgi:hypothetical protein
VQGGVFRRRFSLVVGQNGRPTIDNGSAPNSHLCSKQAFVNQKSEITGQRSAGKSQNPNPKLQTIFNQQIPKMLKTPHDLGTVFVCAKPQ